MISCTSDLFFRASTKDLKLLTGTYRAFLSYSHREAKFARRMHADLESWRIDRDLVGRETPLGPVPKTLRPIFRDREDFAGGGTLTDATEGALKESASLIVLCSPDAAKSAYVNEEIRRFKAMGRADRIIPVIVAGEPGSPDAECFPPALTRAVSSTGELLEEPVEPLAADARDQGDGRRRATAKVVAGLLGIPFDEIAKRSERAQRRRTQILVSVAATMCMLAAAALGFAWLSETRRVAAERNYQAAMKAADSLLGEVGEELIRIEGVRLDTTKRVIKRATSILDDLEKSLPDAQELKVSRVAALAVFAEALRAKGDNDGAIETLRQAETLAQEIAATQSNDEASLAMLAMIRWRLGSSLASTDDHDAAIEKLRDAVDILGKEKALFADQPELQVELASATQLLSMKLAQTGRLDEAAAYGDEAIALIKALQAGAPEEWRYRMLLAGAQIGQGDLLSRQGNKEAALAIYTDAEDRFVDLLEVRPDVPQVRGMLNVVQTNVQMLNDELGQTEAAEAAQRRSVATMRRLAEADAENRSAQSGRADDLAEEGEALAREGSVAEAAARFQESLETLEAMALEFPEDTGVQSSLELALMRAASALNDGGLYGPAEAAGRRLLELREAKLELTPDDPDAIQSVTLALHQLARAVDANGALEDALALHHRRLSLEQQLGAGGTDNRSTRAHTHYAIGLLAWRLSRRDEAIPHYARYNELLAELAAESPEDAGIRVELGQGLLNLGELRVLTGDGPGGLDVFKKCLEVRRALVESGVDGPDRLMELAWAEARLAQFGDAPTERWREVEKLLTRADASTPLGDLEEELLTVARIKLSGAPR